MEQLAPQTEDLRLYLLGLLPPERQPPLEERLLTDAAFYAELLIVEDELIDDYLRGEFTARERDGFESHFMNAPERQQQVRFAGAFKNYVAAQGAFNNSAASIESSPELEQKVESGKQSGGSGGNIFSRLRMRRPALAFSLAAVVLVLVCGVSWLAVRNLRPRETGQVLTVLLTPGGATRSGGDAQQVSVPTGTDALRLRLRLTADEFQSYRATLLNAEGATISTAENLKPEQSDGGQVVVLSVPARNAPPGEYQLRLNGVYADGRAESADNYRFTIVGR